MIYLFKKSIIIDGIQIIIRNLYNYSGEFRAFCVFTFDKIFAHKKVN